jgi:predicted nucleotidyltransferase
MCRRYICWTWGTDEERPDSDVDIAVLLPPMRAKEIGSLVASDLQLALLASVKKEVDLINLRLVSTVFQKQLDLGLMVEVIEYHLDDLIEFTNFIVREFAGKAS